MTQTSVMLRVEEPAWRSCGIDVACLRTAARLALVRGLEHRKVRTVTRGRGLTILLAGDERLRELNARFRGNNAPTNVLSFPALAGDDGNLGDVALALGVATREAAAAGRALAAHARHLAVHGVLHLLGYDHIKAREASTMEHLEIAILRELGIANPYVVTAAAE